MKIEPHLGHLKFARGTFPTTYGLVSVYDELYFRDYLNEHPNIAKEYEQLKLELWKKHEHNRDA